MQQQIVRLSIIFGLMITGLVLARQFLVPETFGDIGHYRAAAIDTIVAREVQYAGHVACGMCHDDIAETHGERRHRGVACEVCHGRSAAHVEDPMEVQPPAPRQRNGCLLCHGYDPSRPTGFPQIDPAVHNPLTPCFQCHDPHQPEPPTTPEECSACHGHIARTKAVSHHALLSCTRCHETQTEHKVNPRLSRPSQPASRSFCGQCHSPEATAPAEIVQEIPRVDMTSHGEGYVCWQCHYPHFPELR